MFTDREKGDIDTPGLRKKTDIATTEGLFRTKEDTHHF